MSKLGEKMLEGCWYVMAMAFSVAVAATLVRYIMWLFE